MHGFPPALVETQLDAALAEGRRILPIAGLQGSGKSTLAAQLAAAARARGLRTAVLSIDDVYLGRRERARLARGVHPLLARRGPPGTHDVGLACDTLDALSAGTAVRLPRFDKLRDTRLPPSRWSRSGPVDLVLFEGWCLHVPAEDPTALAVPLNALEREEDPDAIWRSWCNTALGRDYPALWARLGPPLWLQPPAFEIVTHWRWQQERAMQEHALSAARPHLAARAMRRAEVGRFVQHFERVSRRALATLPALAWRSLLLDRQRRVVEMKADPQVAPGHAEDAGSRASVTPPRNSP